MQKFSVYYPDVYYTAQHVSGVFPPIIRSSVTAVAASGFAFVSWRQSCCFRGRADDFITRTILGKEYRLFSSSLYNFLRSSVTSSFLGPNIFLNTLLSNSLSLRSSLNVSDQVSHPYKTTGKIIFLYILTL